MKTKGLINQSWEVEHEVNGSGELQPLSVRTQRTQRAICDFEYSPNSIEQDEEHAKLIASAPEMLEALKYARGVLKTYGLKNEHEAIIKLSNTIKKATV